MGGSAVDAEGADAHLIERRTWVMARLQMDRRNPNVWVPLTQERVAELVPGRPLTTRGDWTGISLDDPKQIEELGTLFIAAYDEVKRDRVTTEPVAD